MVSEQSQQKTLIFSNKICRLKKVAYLCNPFRKRIGQFFRKTTFKICLISFKPILKFILGENKEDER